MQPIPVSALSPQHPIALIMSPRLGDSLLLMTIAHNLSLSGYQVTVFGTFAYELWRWFPRITIEPALEQMFDTKFDVERDMHPDTASLVPIFKPFGTVIQVHPDIPVAQLSRLHPNVVSFAQWITPYEYDTRHALDQLLDFCEHRFTPQAWGRANGISAPDGLRYRLHAQRVVIHPSASHPSKAWSAQRFIQLARRLRARGFEPVCVVAPSEASHWQGLRELGLDLKVCASLDELAALLHESGWFIGNDSGVGHLASSLGIPTVSIFARVRSAGRWRPIWAPGCVVQHVWLPGGALRRRFWRYTVTVGGVMAALESLRKRGV